MRNREKQSYRILYIIPVSISIVLLFFQLGYAYFDYNCTNEIIALLRSNQIDQASIKAIEEFLLQFDKQYLLTGLEIIGVAISVWIGLNIYNIVKKDDIEKLEKIVEETIAAHDTFIDDYKSFNLSSLSNAIIYEDRINEYFIDELIKNNDKELGYKITKGIFLQEKCLEKVVEMNNADDRRTFYKHLQRLHNEIVNTSSAIDSIKNETTRKILDSLFSIRIADYHYYYALYLYSQKDKSAEKQLHEALQYYDAVANKDDINISVQIVRSYIYNVKSYIYFLLYKITSNIDYIDIAYDCSKIACTNIYNEPVETNYARDHRNYGVNIENHLKAHDKIDSICSETWYCTMFLALEQYMIALKFDKKDVNTLTSISSCILKIFDHKIQLDDEIQKQYINLSQVNIQEKINELTIPNKSTSFDLIEEALFAIQRAQISDNYKLPCHYHAIHINMYLYLLTNDVNLKQKYKNDGLQEIETCIALCNGNSQKYPTAFKYKARNFYYAINENEKGAYFDTLI